MDRIVEPLLRAPIPNLLVVAGLVFLGLGVLATYRDVIKLDRTGRTTAYGLGLILLIVGLIMTINASGGPPSPVLGSVTATPGSLPAPPTQSAAVRFVTSPTSAVVAAQDCFAQYFDGISVDRVASLEEGVRDFDIIGPDQPKDGAIGVMLNDGRQPVGAIKLDFHATNEIFRVLSVVDANCQPVETYSNADRKGDKRVLQNWDTLRIVFAGRAYEVRIGYGGGTIRINYFRRS